MKRVGPFSKGTRQFLVFAGPHGHRIHPVIRSSSSSFLGIPYPKIRRFEQEIEYRRAKVAA